MDLEAFRKQLNPRHKALREALSGGADEQQVITKFLALHGILHSSQVASQAPWSYEDLLLDGLDESHFRAVPPGEEHSLAWILWHLSRIEDLTMNLLVAGRDQVFEAGGWLEKTRSPIRHTGNGTDEAVTHALSAAVDLPALRAYRHTVGHATREIVRSLTRADFSRRVAPEDLQKVVEQGGVIEPGYGVVDYWGKKDVAGLLLMPPTRHTIVHWNEARQIVKKLI